MSSISLSGATQFQYPQLNSATINPSLLEGGGLSPAAQGGGALGGENPLLAGISNNNGAGRAALFQTLQSAVANALNSAGSDTTSGANQIIEQAIEKAI